VCGQVCGPSPAPSVYEQLQIGECSDKLQKFLRRALSKQPHPKRYRDGTAMRRALSETQVTATSCAR
jgi:hypothetical protein